MVVVSGGEPVSRGTARALAAVHERGLVREAQVQVEGSITSAKMRELDFVAYEAMSGQAMLHRWGALLAGDDLLLADDVRFFKDMVKIGKGEVIADLVTKYRRV
jgi:organic radical activating enzyme